MCHVGVPDSQGVPPVIRPACTGVDESQTETTPVLPRRVKTSLPGALGDPDCPRVAERGTQEGIDQAMAAKVRYALALYRPLRDASHAEIRLHRTVLYNSIYRADDDMLVNQHACGIPAAHAPVFHLHRNPETDMFGSYLASFERIWQVGAPSPS